MDPWLLTKSDLATSVNQVPAQAWVKKGRREQWSVPSALPRLGLTYSDWSWPIWMADAKTPLRNCWRSPAHWDSPGYYQTAGSPTPSKPALVPWGSDFRAATAEDGGCLIDLAHKPGHGVEALNIRPATDGDIFLINLNHWINWRWGVRANPGDLIADQLNVRTSENAWAYNSQGGGRCGGKRRAILTAAEVLSGDIGHAFQVTGFTHWGPGGKFVGPLVTRQEHPTVAPKDYPPGLKSGNNLDVPPAGTHFFLPLTTAEMNEFCNLKGYVGAVRSTVLTILRALEHRGFYHGSDTGTGDPQIVTSGVRNLAEKALWDQAGITSAYVASTLLDGLKWSKLRVMA